MKSILEALLFASEKPLTIEQARKVIEDIESVQVRAFFEELKSEYETAGRGVRIAEIAGGYQMITAPDYGSWLRRLFKDRNTEKLSGPALETLAIIAYKQPLTRREIEALRNVNADGVVRTLLDKSLIRVCGRRKVAGRPIVYGTTRQFLEYFGLRTLEDLPRAAELSIINDRLGGAADAGIESASAPGPIGEAGVRTHAEETHEPENTA